MEEKPLAFSLERSKQQQWTSHTVYIKQWRGGKNMGLEAMGHCAQLEKVITKTAACHNVLKQGAGKPAHSHCD